MEKMFPVVFAGHGSPMNAIAESRFRDGWRAMGARLGRPDVIIAVSAHWYVRGRRVSDEQTNRQVFDMYGFPKELYEVSYAPKGDPETARSIASLPGAGVTVDNTWGIDHGVWSVLCNMYPDGGVPVVMVSTDSEGTPSEQFRFGRKLAGLRKPGVMIFASGNVVHNLGLVDWDSGGGAPWAEAFDGYIKNCILTGDPEGAVHFERFGPDWKKAIPTPDHYYPLLTALGAADAKSSPEVWNEGCELGSMSMTSYLL